MQASNRRIPLIVAAMLAAFRCLAAEEPKVNVMLIGWDGAQRNHVQECLERGDLPILRRIAAEGTNVNIEVTGVTDTKAGWTEILTGYGPRITGVFSNGRFQPIPEGYTVFERLRQCFGKDKIVTVAVIGKIRHVGDYDPPEKIRLDESGRIPADGAGGNRKRKGEVAQPGAEKDKRGKVVVEDGVKYLATPGAPYYHTHNNVDVWRHGLMKDEKVGTTAIELIEKYKDQPFFFFVHFAEVDHSGHRSGENSKPYSNALISNDTWTGKIVNKLRELNLYDKTRIYITADHGFDEGASAHRNAPHVFLVTNDKRVCRSGTRADVAPTIYEAFGVEVSAFAPPLTGKSLMRASQ